MKGVYYLYYKYIYKPFITQYIKTDSTITFDRFKLKVFKEVFHPKLFFSSTYFYEFLNKKELNKKTFLEIGCGSGILSLLAFKKNAIVTALDIDPKAIENTAINFKLNFENGMNNVTLLQSDVFDELPKIGYDVIAVNPPYYFRKVSTNKQLAWYCGENGEYFVKLFSGLNHYMKPTTKVYMILAENAEIERIKDMALNYDLKFVLEEERLIKFERSYIFQLNNLQRA